jgi:CelD/BcsL family acetyltransferase involved in cellulose biosynthesis
MTVEKITSVEDFERIRESYERVYERDPHRTVFVSWAWLRSYFASMAPEWVLLAVRRDGAYIGFALVVFHVARVGRFTLCREAALGAYPTGDYTGLLLAREEEPSLYALAEAIHALPWDMMRARNVRDPRIARLLSLLATRSDVAAEPPTRCRYLPLPVRWDRFEAPRPGKRRPRQIVRARRAWSEATLVEANDATIDADIETLLQLRHRRWNSNLPEARRTYGRLFREAYDRGCCRVAVLRQGEAPVAARAVFVDGVPCLNLYMIASDRFRRRAPGLGMLALDIERAIGNRLEEYDFLRGDEEFKRRFGGELRELGNATVRRRTLTALLSDRLWDIAVRAKGPLRRALLTLRLLRGQN